MKRAFYISGLVLLTILVWGQVYSAQFLDYDDNFGRLIEAFLLSLLLLLIGIVLFVIRVGLVTKNSVITIAFLVINSPLTIILAATNYELIFGTALKL